ncbi:MAG TPA: hypothetical protein VHZ24_06830 [Pirellulales bacterium]|jgi:hypothetical protein|nr:hypothetical protein [Pirellulales bacterium]
MKKETAVVSLMADLNYATAWNKFQDLKRQSDELRKRIDVLRGQRDVKRCSLDDAAGELLKSGKFPTAPGAMTAEIQTANEQLAVVNRAVEFAEQEADRLRIEASKKFCRAIRPKYVANVERMKAAVFELAAASAAEREIRETLADGGISFTGDLPPVNFLSGQLDLKEHDSAVGYWLRELAEHYPEVK